MCTLFHTSRCIHDALFFLFFINFNVTDEILPCHMWCTCIKFSRLLLPAENRKLFHCNAFQSNFCGQFFVTFLIISPKEFHSANVRNKCRVMQFIFNSGMYPSKLSIRHQERELLLISETMMLACPSDMPVFFATNAPGEGSRILTIQGDNRTVWL